MHEYLEENKASHPIWTIARPLCAGQIGHLRGKRLNNSRAVTTRIVTAQAWYPCKHDMHRRIYHVLEQGTVIGIPRYWYASDSLWCRGPKSLLCDSPCGCLSTRKVRTFRSFYFIFNFVWSPRILILGGGIAPAQRISSKELAKAPHHTGEAVTSSLLDTWV